MKKVFIQSVGKIQVLSLLVLLPLLVNAQTNTTPNLSAIALAQTIVGSGVTVTSATFNACGGLASTETGTVSAGTFTNTSGDLGLGTNGGVVLTTGSLADVGKIYSYLAKVDLGYTYVDTYLQASIVSNPAKDKYDVCSLTFTFTPVCNSINITYVFGSEEWPSYVCGTGSNAYNDAFGIFLTGPNPSGGNYTGTNIALLPNAAHTPVEIDSINNNYHNQCYPSGTPNPNVAYYVDNTGAKHFADVVYDGLTVPITSTASLTPCSTYVMEIAISDGGNGYNDSGVFLQGGSVGCTNTPPAITSTATPVTTCTANGSASVTVPSTYSATATYSWSPGGQTTSSISGLTAQTYSCLVTIPNYACASTYTTLIQVPVTSVIPNPTGTVSISSTPSTCGSSNGTASVSIAGLSGTPSYTWTPGGQNTSSVSGLSGSTTYSCYVVITNTCGVSTGTTVVTTVTTIPVSIPTITYSSTPSSCTGSTGTASVTVSGLLSSGSVSYTWTPGGQNTSSITGLSPNTYTCNMILSECGITTPTAVVTTVSTTPVPAPAVSISSTPSSCGVTNGTASVTITGMIPGINVNYTWTPSGVGTVISTTNSSTYSGLPGNNTTYSCYVQFSGCANKEDTVFTTITTASVTPPTVSSSTMAPVCTPNSGSALITISNSTLTATYLWSPGGQNTSSISGVPAGDYTCNVTVQGCPSNTHSVIPVIIPSGSNIVSPSFTLTPDSGYAPLQVAFVNTTSGVNTYTWSFGNNTTSNLQNPPNVTYTLAGTYPVILNVSQGSCTAPPDTLWVHVFEPIANLIIPNIFSPNGDGINDLFTINAIGITNFSCLIYDRWGLEMFESSSITNSWDGKNKKGAAVPDGIYFYIIKASGAGLKNTDNKGFVTLIR